MSRLSFEEWLALADLVNIKLTNAAKDYYNNKPIDEKYIKEIQLEIATLQIIKNKLNLKMLGG